MRLIKENRLSFVFLILLGCLFNSCQYISEKKMLIGRWRYMEVLRNDTLLFKLVDTDYIEFQSDNTFHYEIAYANKICNGTWQYKDHILYLKYIQPDTIRSFSIEILSKWDMIFNEGAVNYRFKRQE